MAPVLALALMLIPSVAAGKEPRVADVRHWLYLIDVNLEDETVSRIARSDHDMIVVDFIPSERENVDFPMTEVIARWHNAERPKLVLAYIDVGQAESYRTYWQLGWRIGEPDWITGEDPDGWEENYPVAFWRPEWQTIWLGTDGYLARIIDDGFDGVYLDWIEAYSDTGVMDVAERDGVDAKARMVRFIADIATFGRARRPGFVVVGQNAAELVQEPEYRAAIDAIAQEQTWFDGGADNEPPGDCPLPRRRADVESEPYVASLTPGCRRLHDDFPESTLHMSSEEYLEYLTMARDAGLTVFTVDYSLDPQNVTWLVKTSRAMGFVPFVGSRALDAYVPPVP